ncbi:DNA repair protein RecO (recombination protein O) [Paenibacillus castaneae]|uniref:DNA repair protein RecO n=1 Tax=Paenibacillus castaneae TaxID=474957 RepID=UPI000C9BBAAE|nr:DNA repair protein RecO [Paenibacillus castaneae]NIK77403.1 DNA repair protein RecO (recombination protein O) [Paenibacillus castaneae]
MLYRVEGIVIRSMDYGEGNKIVTLLTKTNGKAGVLIRGAKKIKSKHSSLAQPFTYGEFVYFRSSGLGTLNSGEIIESHHILREQLDLAAYASYAVELTDRSLQDDEATSFHFEQLKACLGALKEGKDPQIVIHLYEMRILDLSGYAPELDECVSCGNRVGPFSLSAHSGGILCSRCLGKDPGAIPLGEGAYKLLNIFRRTDMRRLGSIQVKPETKLELKLCMRRLMDTHLGLQLKSRHFLDQLDKLL